MNTSFVGKGLVVGIIILLMSTCNVPNILEHNEIKKYIESKITAEHSFINMVTNEYRYIETNEKEDNCYGFAIPLPIADNSPATSIQQSIMKLINDLLRQNITVYWTSTQFTATSKKTENSSSELHSFDKGTFIIPFTGNYPNDILLITIIYNYETQSVIDEHYTFEIYYLIETLQIEGYKLNNPKIAYYLGTEIVWDWLVFHFDSLQQAGFLNLDLLLDKEIPLNLTNNKYNSFICTRRGVGQGIEPVIKSFVNTQQNLAIRTFVENGGGYIGIEYGAVLASSGISTLLGCIKSIFNQPPYFGYLSLTKCSYKIGSYNAIVTLRIDNTSSPLTFGLPLKVNSLYENGPIFTWLDQETKPIALIDNISLPYNYYIPNINSSTYKRFEQWKNTVLGKPLWISSNFGKGKVVTYGDDPSIQYPTRNDRILHNSVLYVTSNTSQTINLSTFQPLDTINFIYTIIKNLTLSPRTIMFHDIWKKLEEIQTTCTRIDTLEKNINILLVEMHEERKWKINIHMLPSVDTRLGQIRLRELYYDSFSRFLQGITNAVILLERVVSTINESYPNNLSLLKQWKNQINNSLNNINKSCTEIIDFDLWLTKKLEEFKLNHSEIKNLVTKYDQYDYSIKKCYQFLTQSWLETTKLYRILWYNYLTNMVITSKKNFQFFYPTPPVKETINSSSSNPRILYVDDDSLKDGNGSLEHPFQEIRDAIESASPGDTIYVFSGIYPEHLVISKRINLYGEDKYTTIIDGENKPRHVVWLTADNVEINGFKVTNFSKKYCGGIVFYSSYNKIINNIVSNGSIGLGPGGISHDNIISNNIIENNSYIGAGVDVNYHNNNIFSYNIIRNNGYCGLFLTDSNNTIHDNIFQNNGIIIYPPLDTTSELIIYNNTINGKPLIYYEDKTNITIPNNAGQIILANCSYCFIQDVEINNTNPALQIISSENINLQNGIIKDNLIALWVYDSNHITIFHNKFNNNSWTGVWLYESNQNTISHNLFENNDDGILFYKSKTNHINNNSFSYNNIGVSLWSSSNRNMIIANNFMKNQENTYDQCINHWKRNYWDTWIGIPYPYLRFIPYHILGGINIDWHPAKEPYDIP